MKQSSLLIVIISLMIISFTLTGFQCGSPALTSAKLYIKNADWANAEKSLLAEVEKNPSNAEAWYYLGDVRRQTGNFEGMVSAFDKSTAASNEFAKVISDTKMSIWGNSINGAVNMYNKSINASKDSASGLRQNAISLYKRAILVVPDSALPYRNLAIAYRLEGDYDNEIASLKKSLTLKKDFDVSVDLIDAYKRKARAAKDANNTSEANINYSNAIDVLIEAEKNDPNNQAILGEIINTYIEAERAKDALPFLRKAVEKDPKNKIFQNNLGLLLMQTEEFEEATQCFEAAIAIDDTYEDGLWNGTVAYLKYGEKMKKAAEAAADPKNKEKSIDKSYLEKFKSATKLALKLTAVKKDEPKYWDGLATAYANAGMGKDAQKAFEQADALRKNK